jgi:hypothetical protein
MDMCFSNAYFRRGLVIDYSTFIKNRDSGRAADLISGVKYWTSVLGACSLGGRDEELNSITNVHRNAGMGGD